MIEIIPNWHPFLVHFTIAFLSSAVVLYGVSHLLKPSEFKSTALTVAKWNLYMGVVASLLTGAAGLYAYNTVAHDTASHNAMTDHRNWAIATLVVFFVIAVWSFVSKSLRARTHLPFILLSFVGLTLLMTTGYKGAETVYRYGLGVMSLPQSDGEGHAHEHADGQQHDHKNSSPVPSEHDGSMSQVEGHHEKNGKEVSIDHHNGGGGHNDNHEH